MACVTARGVRCFLFKTCLVARCRGHGLSPWSGKIPRATKQPTTTEPARPQPKLRNKRGHLEEKPEQHNQEEPLCAVQCRPSEAKNE